MMGTLFYATRNTDPKYVKLVAPLSGFTQEWEVPLTLGYLVYGGISAFTHIWNNQVTA